MDKKDRLNDETIADIQVDLIFRVMDQLVRDFDQTIIDQLDPYKDLPWYQRMAWETIDQIRRWPREWRLKKVAWHRMKKLVRCKMNRGENPSRALIKHAIVGLTFVDEKEMPSERIKWINYIWFMS